MDIDLLSKMVKEIILDKDEVTLPGVGTFVTEFVGASFSDKGYTINPPYRRLYFRQRQNPEDTSLVDFYVKSNPTADKEQAERIIKDFLLEMKEVLSVKKTLVFPGLGRLRATKENNIFFVADEDLDIYPEGIGLEPISLKTHKESSEDVAATVASLRAMVGPVPAEEVKPDQPQEIPSSPSSDDTPSPSAEVGATPAFALSQAGTIPVPVEGAETDAVPGTEAVAGNPDLEETPEEAPDASLPTEERVEPSASEERVDSEKEEEEVPSSVEGASPEGAPSTETPVQPSDAPVETPLEEEPAGPVEPVEDTVPPAGETLGEPGEDPTQMVGLSGEIPSEEGDQPEDNPSEPQEVGQLPADDSHPSGSDEEPAPTEESSPSEAPVTGNAEDEGNEAEVELESYGKEEDEEDVLSGMRLPHEEEEKVQDVGEGKDSAAPPAEDNEGEVGRGPSSSDEEVPATEEDTEPSSQPSDARGEDNGDEDDTAVQEEDEESEGKEEETDADEPSMTGEQDSTGEVDDNEQPAENVPEDTPQGLEEDSEEKVEGIVSLGQSVQEEDGPSSEAGPIPVMQTEGHPGEEGGHAQEEVDLPKEEEEEPASPIGAQEGIQKQDSEETTSRKKKGSAFIAFIWILCAVLFLVLVFFVLTEFFPDFLDKLLYSKEDLEFIRQSGM